ncbi:MAG: class I SAM-dependent methyltransferase, partial [Rhodospirillaceae bacterium]|nr:class I SAM-dependent methyltransferase [Rhodospirillaceae bacterium]
GYDYDGRYGGAAAAICHHYNLLPGSRILEIGCAKGFLLYEFHRLGLAVSGLDISDYAVSQAHPDIQRFLCLGDTSSLPYPDDAFDLVLAKEILPHVPEGRLPDALAECARVSRGGIYFVVQAVRGDRDREEMAAWDPTHQVLRSEAWWHAALAGMPKKPDVTFKFLF